MTVVCLLLMSEQMNSTKLSIVQHTRASFSLVVEKDPNAP